MDTVDEAQRLREVSENLRDRSINTATKIEDGILTDIHSFMDPFHNFMRACAYLFPSGNTRNVNKRFLQTNSTFQ